MERMMMSGNDYEQGDNEDNDEDDSDDASRYADYIQQMAMSQQGQSSQEAKEGDHSVSAESQDGFPQGTDSGPRHHQQPAESSLSHSVNEQVSMAWDNCLDFTLILLENSAVRLLHNDLEALIPLSHASMYWCVSWYILISNTYEECCCCTLFHVSFMYGMDDLNSHMIMMKLLVYVLLFLIESDWAHVYLFRSSSVKARKTLLISIYVVTKPGYYVLKSQDFITKSSLWFMPVVCSWGAHKIVSLLTALSLAYQGHMVNQWST